MAKNKALNESFTAGMDALKAQQYDDAVTAFTKASEMDAKQHVVWANLAESLFGTGQDQDRRRADGPDDEGLRRL